jgi:serine/threonine protein kinase
MMKLIFFLVVLTSLVQSTQLRLESVETATLYQVVSSEGSLPQNDRSNGGGTEMFVGNAGLQSGNATRRSLIRFDLSSVLELLRRKGLQVAALSSARLYMECSKVANAQPVLIDMYPLVASWGEGNVSATMPGQGAPAQLGDATWHWNFFNESRWRTDGGDYNNILSASSVVGGTGRYSWSDDVILNQVRTWLTNRLTTNHSNNNGWLLKTREESGVSANVKAFYSRHAGQSDVSIVRGMMAPMLAVAVDDGVDDDDNAGDSPPWLWIGLGVGVGVVLLVALVAVGYLYARRRRRRLLSKRGGRASVQRHKDPVRWMLLGGRHRRGGDGGGDDGSGDDIGDYDDDDGDDLGGPRRSYMSLSGTRAKLLSRGLENNSSVQEALDAIVKLPGIALIERSDLEIGELVGTGAVGEVYRGQWLSRGGIDVAIKTCLCLGQAGLREFVSEVRILATLDHPNILRLHGVAVVHDPAAVDGIRVMLVADYMEYGSLTDILDACRRDEQTMPWNRMLSIAIDVALGMHYLHSISPPIVHRDLKPGNVLIGANWHVVIADFGLSRVLRRRASTMSSIGTPLWMAPEAIHGGRFSEKSDVYSFGIVLGELTTLERPYSHVDQHHIQIMFRVVSDKLRPRLPDDCDPQWRALIVACVAAEPANRPTFRQIIDTIRTIKAKTSLSPQPPSRHTPSASSPSIARYISPSSSRVDHDDEEDQASSAAGSSGNYVRDQGSE